MTERKPAARTTTPRKKTGRTTTARKTTTRKRTTSTRRRTSTASTAGTAVGAALAGVIVALVAGMPWWGWVIVAVVVLAAGVGYLVSRARAAASEPDGGTAPEDGQPA